MLSGRGGGVTGRPVRGCGGKGGVEASGADSLPPRFSGLLLSSVDGVAGVISDSES